MVASQSSEFKIALILCRRCGLIPKRILCQYIDFLIVVEFPRAQNISPKLYENIHCLKSTKSAVIEYKLKRPRKDFK